MAFLTAFPVVIALILALLVIVLNTALRRSKRLVQSAEQQLERFQDEVWELKSAAAARDKAEAASEAKSRFLATVSHEFRTPLNGILGLTELLAATPLNAEQISYLSAIRASGDALASLINEILDFSRLEAGKLESIRTAFDLPALIEGAVELLSPRAHGKGIEICSIVEKDLPGTMIGDPGRLRQVLINLAGNAVKFTEKGGVAVEVTRHSGKNVRFSVSDTGAGIQESRQTAIFQDFEQGDGSSTRRYEGTGLGLAISRRIVEHLGGKLWLEQSGPGGSRFCFDIPFDIPLDSAETLSPRGFHRELAGRRILIVGDAPFGCQHLARRLSDAGANAIVARGREDAAVWLNKGDAEPDFMIIDCSLGEQAICDLSNLARRLPDCKSVLLFSPFERREFGEALLKDFHGWLVKPVRLESVARKLSRLSNRNSLGQEARNAEPPAPSLAGKHILLAEDNDLNALLVERQLGKLGAQLFRARDGLEAIKLVQDSFSGVIPPFTAALMDLRMPGLDGLSATKAIRAIEQSHQRQPLPIIALTANAFDEDRAAALEAGMQTFLTKPVDLAALAQTLDEVADARMNARSTIPS